MDNRFVSVYENDYPSCCSVVVLADFNDSDAVQLTEDNLSFLKTKLEDKISQIKRNGHYTVITAILVRRQENIAKLLQDMGFYHSPKWMKKASYRTERPHENDTMLFFLPCGLEVD